MRRLSLWVALQLLAPAKVPGTFAEPSTETPAKVPAKVPGTFAEPTAEPSGKVPGTFAEPTVRPSAKVPGTFAEPTAGPSTEPPAKVPGTFAEPTVRPSAKVPGTFKLTPLLELGWSVAPAREERGALPWRAREVSGLYPARLSLGLSQELGGWRYGLNVRLTAQPYAKESEQASASPDPLGQGPGLNELWLAHSRSLNSSELTLKVGRWVPELSESALGEGGEPWRLESVERLWSSAPDPRDRAVSGLELSWERSRGGGWRPQRASLALITPSATLALYEPHADTLNLGGLLSLLWRQRGLGELTLSAGAQRAHALRWGRLKLNAKLSERWRYRLIALYRAQNTPKDPLQEAREATLGLSGEGVSVSHELKVKLAQALHLGATYEWRDPQLDFNYNAQHVASLGVGYHASIGLEAHLEYRHLWSGVERRWQLDADLALFVLRYHPTLSPFSQSPSSK